MTTKQTPALDLISYSMNSHRSSWWMINALKMAEERDPLDVLRDAESIVHIFKMRCDELLNESRESVTS
jgi:hypothetical protein